jgi:hypothetical protein
MAGNLMGALPSKDWDSAEQPEYAADYDANDNPWLIEPRHPINGLKKWRVSLFASLVLITTCNQPVLILNSEKGPFSGLR